MSEPRLPTIRPARRDDRGAVASVLAVAFREDPFFRYFIPDLDVRERFLPVVMAAQFALTFPEQATWVAASEGQVTGALIAVPPGRYPLPLRRTLRFLQQMLLKPVPWVPGPASYRRGWPYLMAWDRLHHELDFEHWYVFIVGVDPAFQGRGIGRALMQQLLRQADTGGWPVYLETQNPANVPFYRGMGFELRRKLQVDPVGPTVHTMLRG